MTSMRSLWTVMKKELRELSRDRRTLMLALVMGPLLTPALILGMSSMAEKRAKSQIEKPLTIAIVGAERAVELFESAYDEHARRLAKLYENLGA